jgi:hypothetical protein
VLIKAYLFTLVLIREEVLIPILFLTIIYRRVNALLLNRRLKLTSIISIL